jgi:hypothetical protein
MPFFLILKDECRKAKDHCCQEMSTQVNLFSEGERGPLQGTTDKRVYWSPIFDEYGLICQPSAEILAIRHCPFCGTRLPMSRRDAWFARLERTGWRAWGDPIPRSLLNHDWDEQEV